MKKVLSLLMMAGFAAMIACGPSAEEKAAADKMRQDSINTAMEKMRADSMAMVEKSRQDSTNAAMEKMRADSAAKAEEAKKSAPKPKAKAPAKPTETPKVGHKKPGVK